MADSGVNYTAAMISNSDAMTNTLNGNPFDNAQRVSERSGPGQRLGPPRHVHHPEPPPPDDPNAATQPYRFGLADEAGKINVNALLQLDNGKGDAGYTILMDLPNMTEDVANAILDWISPSDTPRTDGAKDDYYSSLTPPYHCKNGPLDSLEELLLVQRRNAAAVVRQRPQSQRRPRPRRGRRQRPGGPRLVGLSDRLQPSSRTPTLRATRASTSTTPTSTAWARI